MNRVTILLLALSVIAFDAKSQDSERTQEEARNKLQFTMWNSAALVRLYERSSVAPSSIRAQFWAYQFRGELVVLNRYVLRGRLLLGSSASVQLPELGNITRNMELSHTIWSAGFGYRIFSLGSVRKPDPLFGEGVTISANFKSVARTDAKQNTLRTDGIELTMEFLSGKRWGLLVFEGGIHFMPFSRWTSNGTRIPGHKRGNSFITVSAGVGIELIPEVTLMFGIQLQDNIRHVLEENQSHTFGYPAYLLTLKTVMY